MNPDRPTPAPPAPAHNDLDQRQLVRLLQDFHQLRRQREQAYEALARAHRVTLSKLALAAEYKDGDTGIHIVRIGALSEDQLLDALSEQ
ncbi:MAG: hypothetical protein QMC09_16920, partial [Thauera sp.]